MGRFWVVVCVLAGCGRISFDAPGALGDGSVGAPCVSHNSHDEDGDGIPDDCDGCPVASDPDQPDDDRDGVTNDCDTDADRIDTIVSFEGFDGLDGWQIGDNVTIAGDSITLDGTAAPGYSTVGAPITLDGDDFLEWRGRITAGAGVEPEHATIELGTENGMSIMYCEIINVDAGMNGEVQFTWTFDSSTYHRMSSDHIVQTIVGGEGGLLQMHITGDSINCNTMWSAVGSGTGSAGGARPAGIPSTHVQFTSQRVKTELEWFMHRKVQ